MKSIALSAAAIVLFLFALVPPAAGATLPYVFTYIDYPNAINTIFGGINNEGEAVGNYGKTDSGGGFMEKNGTFQGFKCPSADATMPLAINNNGRVTGWWTDPKKGTFHGFVMDGKGFKAADFNVNINYPKATRTYPCGINDTDVIVGWYEVQGKEVRYHGFIYNPAGKVPYTSFDYSRNSVWTSLNGVNNNGDMVGRYSEGNNVYAFVRTGGVRTKISYPSKTWGTFPKAINNHGDIAGHIYHYDTTSGNLQYRGFVYSKGKWTVLDAPKASPGNTFVTGINDSGEVCGYYQTGSGSAAEYHGFTAIPQ